MQQLSVHLLKYLSIFLFYKATVKLLCVVIVEECDLPLSMSNLAVSLPSSTILPGRDNLKKEKKKQIQIVTVKKLF